MISGRIPATGDFLIARGKSWIVENAEQTGPVQTLRLVSCEDDSQGETLQLALAAELQTQVVDTDDWSPLLTATFRSFSSWIRGSDLGSIPWRSRCA